MKFTINPTYYYPVERAMHQAGINIDTQSRFTKMAEKGHLLVEEVTVDDSVANVAEEALKQFMVQIEEPKMKTISQIQKGLDEINNAVFTEQSSAALRELENDWEGCFSLELGEMRDVIEDRFTLAHSRRRRAGL